MWEKITVGMFQELYDIITGHNFEHELERKIRLLSCLDGKPIDYFEQLPLRELQAEIKRVDFLSTEDIPTVPAPCLIEIAGQRFKVIYEFKDLSSGQFIDAITSAKEKDEYIMNLDKTLAAICVPINGKKLGRYGDVPYDEVCDLMKQLPILQANAIALFFCQVWNSFLEAIPDSLAKKKRKGKELTEMEAIVLAAAFHNDGDGSTAQLRLQKWNESL